jgi:hypothetical protein
MSKHTPGPWEVGYHDKHGQRTVLSQHIEICTCWHHSVGAIEKEMEANARLIAAAPDLLAALELIASFGGKTLIGDGRYDEGAAHAFAQAADVASAALAKAVTEPRTPPTTTEDQ